jgi:hypothetical protein
VDNFTKIGLSRLESEHLGYLVLDLLYQYEQENPSLLPDIGELALHAKRENDLPALSRYITEIQGRLEELGFITLAKVLAGPMAHGFRLTAAGRSQAAHARSQRENSVARKSACRIALLLWLYEQDEKSPGRSVDLGSFFSEPLSFFWGYHFEAADVDRAGRWLKDNDFTTSIDAWGGEVLRARIATKGIDCVENDGGDLASYARRTQMSSGQTINVHGANSGQIGMASGGNVEQLQQSGQDLQKILDTISGVKDALPALKLQPEDGVAASAAADEVEKKAQEGTLTKEESKSLMKRIGALVAKSGSHLAPMVLGAVEELAQ